MQCSTVQFKTGIQSLHEQAALRKTAPSARSRCLYTQKKAFHSTGGQQREIHQGIQQAMHQSGNIQQSLAQQTPQSRSSPYKKGGNQKQGQKQEFKCEFCQVYLNSQKQLDQHNGSPKHIMTKNSVSKLMNPQGQQQQGYGTQMGTQFSPGQMQNNKRPKLGSQNMQRGPRVGFRPRVPNTTMIGPIVPNQQKNLNSSLVNNPATTDNPF